MFWKIVAAIGLLTGLQAAITETGMYRYVGIFMIVASPWVFFITPVISNLNKRQK